MEKLFKRKRLTSSPVTGSEDRVVPLHFFEDSLLVQGNNMAVSLVFDDVLDPEMLRSSLEGLVKRDGWQRLGGRLRKNVRKFLLLLYFSLFKVTSHGDIQSSMIHEGDMDYITVTEAESLPATFAPVRCTTSAKQTLHAPCLAL
jgi:hypothetical protein